MRMFSPTGAGFSPTLDSSSPTPSARLQLATTLRARWALIGQLRATSAAELACTTWPKACACSFCIGRSASLRHSRTE